MDPGMQIPAKRATVLETIEDKSDEDDEENEDDEYDDDDAMTEDRGLQESTKAGAEPKSCCGRKSASLGGKRRRKRRGLVGRVLCDPRFWVVGFSLAVYVSMLTILESHLVTYAAQDAGQGQHKSSTLTIINGVAGIVGRIVFTLIATRRDIPLLTQFQLCVIITGLSVFGLAVYGTSHAYLIIMSVLTGFFGGPGVIYGLVVPTLGRYFGPSGLSIALGGTYTVRAPSVLLASPIAGYIRDATGSYNIVWTLSGVMMVLSAFPIFFTQCMRKRKEAGA
jgi:predicted MFS family arabinose efflux permease